MDKKSGKKKEESAPTPSDAAKLLAERINQLELVKSEQSGKIHEVAGGTRKAMKELEAQTVGMNDQEVIKFLHKKCMEFHATMKIHEHVSIELDSKSSHLIKGMVEVTMDLAKMTKVRDNLASLCRELQKQNKTFRDANHSLAKRLSEKEKALSDKEKYAEKTSASLLKIPEHSEEVEPRQVVDGDTSELFRQRFKSFIDQYELQELHFQSVMRTKDLEVQCIQARFESEKNDLEAKLSTAEADLRKQRDEYAESFKRMQGLFQLTEDKLLALNKHMEEVSRNMQGLEEEKVSLKKVLAAFSCTEKDESES